MEKEKIIILTEPSCEGCDFVKQKLEGKQNIHFIDINNPEAGKYIKEDSIIVPSAVYKGARCLIKLDNGKLKAECENGSVVNLED